MGRRSRLFHGILEPPLVQSSSQNQALYCAKKEKEIKTAITPSVQDFLRLPLLKRERTVLQKTCCAVMDGKRKKDKARSPEGVFFFFILPPIAFFFKVH